MSPVLSRRTPLAALIASALLALAPPLHAADGRSPRAEAPAETRPGGKGESGRSESGKGETSRGETSRSELSRGESAKAETRKVTDEPDAGRRERGGKRPRESMSSDEAIEQLSTRIAEKLATMKAPESKGGDAAARMVLKNPAPPRTVVRTAYNPTDLARTAAAANGQTVPSLPPPRAAAEAPAGGHGAPSAAVAGVRRSTALAAAAAAHAEHRHWSYSGDTGPDKWAELNPEYAKCSDGTRQSPIDIRDGIKVELDPIAFDYKPTGFSVVDNGHTVQVNVGTGNAIVVNGRRFELVQFHFHRPSEERVGGRLFDMVAHLVHKDVQGRLAVVAVLIDRGTAHPVIQQVWNNLPLERGEPWVAQSPIDVTGLLPKDRGYWTYMGSLTTPPCSEGVLWMVMKQPVQVSVEQIAVFGRLYPMNARPVQQASGRMIKESN